MTNSSYDAPSEPLLQKLEWKCIEELISDEKKLTVFKSLNDLGPNYMHTLFAKNSHFTEQNL